MKKFFSLILSLVMAITLSPSVFATSNDSEVVYNDDGSYFVLEDEPIVVRHYNQDGYLLDESQVDDASGEIISKIYNPSSNSVTTTSSLQLDDIITVEASNVNYLVDDDTFTPLSPSISPYSTGDEPLLSNNGLKGSSVFPGWYEIGHYGDSTYPQYTATVNRKFSGKYYATGEAYRLTVTPGMAPSAITAAILGFVFTGGHISGAVAGFFTDFITNAVKESFDAKITFHSFHYLYQVGINRDRTPQHKYCRSVDFWYCEVPNDYTYRYRGATPNHYNGTNHAEQATTALADYASRRPAKDLFCGITK